MTLLGAGKPGRSARDVLNGNRERWLYVSGSDEDVLTRSLVGEVSAVKRLVMRVSVRRTDTFTFRRPDVCPTSRLTLAVYIDNNTTC